jgi:hypothetical protein
MRLSCRGRICKVRQCQWLSWRFNDSSRWSGRGDRDVRIIPHYQEREERLRCCLWIVDPFNLDERGVWFCVSLSPLVREMLSPVIEPVSVGGFGKFLVRCSWPASDIYFDGVIANMVRECLLDVYYRQEESVMASQNACRANQRLLESDGFAYICGLIRASWRIQRPAEERTTGTKEA